MHWIKLFERGDSYKPSESDDDDDRSIKQFSCVDDMYKSTTLGSFNCLVKYYFTPDTIIFYL